LPAACLTLRRTVALSSMKSAIVSFLAGLWKEEEESERMQIQAVPGLMTLLDVALYRTVEGQLTATIHASHQILEAWLDVKRQAVTVLQALRKELDLNATRRIQLDGFARTALDAACDAVERLTTDKLAQTANLSDPFPQQGTSGNAGSGINHHYSHSISANLSHLDESSRNDTGRRIPMRQRGKDCWESPRLHCPDYVWAEDFSQACHRLIKHLYKHPFLGDDPVETSTVLANAPRKSFLMSADTEHEAQILVRLLKTDIPVRLYQFRASMEADSVVSKRLYLVKCEYRAPFRAFLEAHQSVQRAPSLELVGEYTSGSNRKVATRREEAKERLSKLLETPCLVKSLALEQEIENSELEIAKILYPFCELARYVEHKNARLKSTSGLVDEDNVIELQDLLRRLKGLLCRRTTLSTETSAGIRPLLLDLQCLPRDEDGFTPYQTPTAERVAQRATELVNELQILSKISQKRHVFATEGKHELDLRPSISRGCNDLDGELLHALIVDWFSMVHRQHEVIGETDFQELAEKLRHAEMQMSLAVATNQSLAAVRDRLNLIHKDREMKFQVLKETLEDLSLREMNLDIEVSSPDRHRMLSLQPTSALGVFGQAMQLAGEALPIG
jgi:hypothetical protein